ncbi:MAG: hypothetical protein JNK74_10580 [Candidatus Hydrogenedentes bacterium]|nr:hypothetical protein [Candidatus Hydrogenedentota bacterium]
MEVVQDNIKVAVQRAIGESGLALRFSTSATDDSKELEVHLSIGVELLVIYYSGLASHQVPLALAHLRKRLRRGQFPALCVRRLTWSLLDRCRELKVAVFDLEGNVWLRVPGMYIERLRPSQEPRPEPSTGTVFTAKASRILRGFLKKCPDKWTQADIVRETGLSAGYVSTLAQRMIAQRYLRKFMGAFWLEDPDQLLQDWLAHYRFDRHVKHSFAISAGNYDEGAGKLKAALEAAGVPFAWTGWTGAHLRAPYATPSMYTAYVSEIPKKLADVFPVERGGNVTLYVPQDAGVLQFTTETSLGPVVSDAQLYLDLCRMPGRAREQAEALRHTRLDFAGKVG